MRGAPLHRPLKTGHHPRSAHRPFKTGHRPRSAHRPSRYNYGRQRRKPKRVRAVPCSYRAIRGRLGSADNRAVLGPAVVAVGASRSPQSALRHVFSETRPAIRSSFGAANKELPAAGRSGVKVVALDLQDRSRHGSAIVGIHLEAIGDCDRLSSAQGLDGFWPYARRVGPLGPGRGLSGPSSLQTRVSTVRHPHVEAWYYSDCRARLGGTLCESSFTF